MSDGRRTCLGLQDRRSGTTRVSKVAGPRKSKSVPWQSSKRLGLLLGSANISELVGESVGRQINRGRRPMGFAGRLKFPVTPAKGNGLSSRQVTLLRKRVACGSSAPAYPASFGGLSGISPALGHPGVTTRSGAEKSHCLPLLSRRRFPNSNFTRGLFSCSSSARGRPRRLRCAHTTVPGSVHSQGLCHAGGVLDLDTSRRRFLLGLRATFGSAPHGAERLGLTSSVCGHDCRRARPRSAPFAAPHGRRPSLGDGSRCTSG